MRLISIQIGLPRTLGIAGAPDFMHRAWTSGIFKDTVPGSIEVTPTGLVGDGQADLKNHGGPDKAINAYPSEYFDTWRRELGFDATAGAFGENFTTAGATESDVSIGDIFRIGSALVQITQPRQPCWKLARRWRIKELAARVEQTGRTGWYFRVLETGTVSAPNNFLLQDRPYPQWTIAEANRVMHHAREDWDAARDFATCPALSASWKTTLEQRATTRTVRASTTRLEGPAT